MATRRRLRESQRRRSRRIRALLAAGAVFGVGAAGTLAAWNDSEHATTTITAGTFDIEGAVDGAVFTDHNPGDDPPSAPATLTFSTGFDAMTPGTTVYALFSVRTKDPSVAGTVQLNADEGNDAGLGEHLEYGVRTITGTNCDQTAYDGGTVVVAGGSALTTGASGSQTLVENGGNTVDYCFAITLPTTAPNAAQGTTVSPSWEFHATAD